MPVYGAYLHRHFTYFQGGMGDYPSTDPALVTCLLSVIHMYAPESINLNAQQAFNVDPSSHFLWMLVTPLEKSKRYR
jgi:hypothetical protein